MKNEKTWDELSYEEKIKCLDKTYAESEAARLTTTGGDWRMAQIPSNTHQYVPYQICPLCNGMGRSLELVIDPKCTVCNGAKIIPMHHIQEPVSCPHVYSPDNEPPKPTILEWLVLKTTTTSWEGDAVQYTELIAKFPDDNFGEVEKFVAEQTKGQYGIRIIVVMGVSFE